MRFIELFAGVGGFRYGLEKTTGYQCVYANEWDKYAASIYRYHWNDGTLCEGDIRAVEPSELPEHDLIVGGFPCQTFSIAGKRAGFADIRGTLFFEICRLARAYRTKYLFLENVKGLLNHEGGLTFQTIISTLDELGYDCQWQVLNSKNFGVPQNRERVFIIANLRTEPRPQVFPIPSDETPDFVIPTLTSRYYDRQANGGYISYTQEEDKIDIKQLVNGSQGQRVYDPDGLSVTICGAKTGLYAIPVLTPDRETRRQNGRRFKEDGDDSFTLTAQDRHGVYDGCDIRRLTPLECERLQAFPDNWTQYGLTPDGNVTEISDTQRYKTMGNAVTTSVITAIGNKLSKSLQAIGV